LECPVQREVYPTGNVLDTLSRIGGPIAFQKGNADVAEVAKIINAYLLFLFSIVASIIIFRGSTAFVPLCHQPAEILLAHLVIAVLQVENLDSRVFEEFMGLAWL